MKVSKIIISLFSAVIILSSSFIAFADDGYIVSSPDIAAKQEESITIPINLSQNKGLMGFRITVRYPEDKLKLTNVSSGSLTADGLFNTTVSSYEALKGEFDILWSDSKETKSDGTLAVMTYSIKSTADNGKCSIELSYSQDDTFNEKLEDVKLKCSPIKVTVGEEEQTAEPETEATTKSNNDTSQIVSDDYLVSSVNEITNSFGKSDIEQLDKNEQKTALEYVNNRVESFGGGKKYSDFEELKTDYSKALKNEAVRKVLESTDDERIAAAKNEVLKEYGVSSFKEIPKEKKKEANEKMLQKLKDSGADLSGFENINDEETVAEKLDDIVSQSEKRNNKAIDVTADKNSSKKAEIVIAVIAVSVAAIAIIGLVILKRRQKNEKAE